MKVSRRLVRRVFFALVVAPVVLVLLLAVALYIPAVQDRLVRYAAERASLALGMQVQIGRLRLGFPLALRLDSLRILKTPTDTLASLDELRLDLSLSALLRSELQTPSITAQGISIAYTDSLQTTTLRARLERLETDDLLVATDRQHVYIAGLRTRSGEVYYSSTDTTTGPTADPLHWLIEADQIQLVDTKVRAELPHDSLYVDASVSLLQLDAGRIALETSALALGEGRIEGANIAYSTHTRGPSTPYLDYSHIALSDLDLHLKDLVQDDGHLSLQVLSAKARERSGLSLALLQGGLSLDSLGLQLEELALRTEHSGLYGTIRLPWAFVRADSTARAMLHIDGTIGMPDIRIASGADLLALGEQGDVARTLEARQLTAPISFGLHAEGSIPDLQIEQLFFMWEEVCDLSASGRLYDLHRPLGRRGAIHLEGGLQHRANSLLGIVSPALAQRYNLPNGLVLAGDLRLGGGNHYLDLVLRDRDARAHIKGSVNEYTQQYQGELRLEGLDVRRFAPHEGIGLVRGELTASGRGTDPFSPTTEASLRGRIHQVEYNDMSLGNLTADGELYQGELSLAINSFNPGLNVSLLLDALLNRSHVYSSIMLDSEGIDMKALGLSEMPLGAKFRLSGELRSDMREAHSLVARIEDLRLQLDESVLSPEEVQLEVRTNATESTAHLSSGDLKLSAHIGEGPSALAARGTTLGTLASSIVEEATQSQPMTTRLESIIGALPELDLDLEMGRANALKDFLAQSRIAIERVEGHLRARKSLGIEGHFTVRDLRQDTLRINCIDLDIGTRRHRRLATADTIASRRRPARRVAALPADSMELVLSASVDKQSWRRQPSFMLRTQLRTTLQQATLALSLDDQAGRTIHAASLSAHWDGTHYRISIPTTRLTIAYQPLEVNAENYLELEKRRYLLASHLAIKGGNNTALELEASDLDGTGQEVSLLVRQLHLEDFRALGLPDVSGIVSTDLRYSRSGGLDQQPIITGDLAVQELRYEDKQLGHFATALFYEPRNDHSHYITAELSYKGHPALSIDGIYHPDRTEAPLSGTIALRDFPLEIANPFLAQYATYLDGSTSGSLRLAGTLASPDIQGDMRASSASVDLRNYATRLQLDTIPLRLEGTTLHFDHYAIRSSVDSQHPVYIDGQIEAFGKRAMQTNLRVQSDETVLLNQSKPKEDTQLVYGRLVASTDLRLTGKMNALKVRGRLAILGGTNCTYIMREASLDASDNASGLVSYVDFADTLFVSKPTVEAELGGHDVNVSLQLDPSVRFGVDLTADGIDYVRMQGGGQMQLRYPPFGEMSLTGRYEMTGGGTMHYTMPVVGGKLFTIDPRGYVLFDGNVSNPYVNFVATQQVRASAGGNMGATTFVVSIKAKDYIGNINLAFDLAAPENLSIQNSLSTMTAEERGKQAIGLLATGTYLAAEGGANLSFDSALASLLQSRINSAAGSLLKGTDLSVGMEMGDGTSGSAYTNYTYSFSRRFYNDRIRVVIGGKIQTGGTATNRDKSLIDNVSLEYQIDKAGERYVQLYHNLITDNILEGEYTETGAGFLLRRKLQRLNDLFRGRKRRAIAPADSTSTSQWRGLPLALPTADTLTPQSSQRR